MHAAIQARAAVPRVTLYIRESDGPIWDRARALSAGSEDSLSSLVSEGLEIVVERRERLTRLEKEHAEQMESVEVEGVDWWDDDKPRKLRFVGLMASEANNVTTYITRSKKIVVEQYRPGAEANLIAVFDSFDEFREAAGRRGFHLDPSQISETAEALGEDYFEEID